MPPARGASRRCSGSPWSARPDRARRRRRSRCSISCAPSNATPRRACSSAARPRRRSARCCASIRPACCCTATSWAGWLDKFNRYQGDGSERELWLASHGGRRYCLERLKDPWPASVPHLTIGILGAIAPDKVAKLVRGGADELCARFLWCWPDPAPGYALAPAPIDNAKPARRVAPHPCPRHDDDEGRRAAPRAGSACPAPRAKHSTRSCTP